MKKINGKRTISLVLLIVMLTGLLTACGKPDDGDTSGNEPKTSGEDTSGQDDESSGGGSESGYQTTFGDKVFDNVTITAMVFDRSNAPDGQTATDNIWTEYINEKMNEVGITVEFVAVPRSDELNKVNTMMASGTGADIMLTYTGTVVQDFYQKGGIHDLSEYIDGEDQARNLKDYLGQDVIDVGRLPNGEVWSIPARRSTTARTNFNIRKDWLDALNLEVPKTVDELYDALVAFKENNPEGRDDVVASFHLGGNAGPIAHAFLESVTTEKDYAIAYPDLDAFYVYTDPGYVEFLRWMNKLYNEGILDPEYYVSEDFSQTQKEQFVNGQLSAFEYDVNGNVDSLRGGLLQNLKANNPDAEFVSIPPLENVHDGKAYNPGYPINGAFVFIPKTATNVEAAVTYLDWLATEEGGFTIFHGHEGEHFEYEDGIPVVKDAEYNADTKDWTRHDLFLIGNQGYYLTEDEFNKATSKELPGWEEYVLENYGNATAGILRNAPTFSSPTATEQSANLQTTKDTYLVKIVTGTVEEFDKNVEEYKSELEKYGVEDIIKERTEYYNEFYGE